MKLTISERLITDVLPSVIPNKLTEQLSCIDNIGRYLLMLLCTFMLGACSHNDNKQNFYKYVPEEHVLATPKLSVQLHSVKNSLANDYKGTLVKLAKMGIEGVEFAGRFGPYQQDPEGLRAFLKTLGLQASGAHIGLKQLRGKAFDKNVRFYQKLGVSLLIVPHDVRVDQPNKVTALVKELTKVSAKLNAVGMTLGYHNHTKEFKRYQDSTFWDYLAQNTPQNMVLQLDVGWSNFANVDSIAYIKRYAKRTLTSHIKIRTLLEKSLIDKVDDTTAVVIGKDVYNWSALVNTLISHGGAQWLVIEQEETHAGISRLQTLAASVDGLKAVMILR
ncbi:MAG: sugar phosphate isomerase/epimerase family protein [Thalassotalea sp.]